jgi:D-cysteine desulfhydrase
MYKAIKYTAPKWLKIDSNILPTHRYELIKQPTPIEKLNLNELVNKKNKYEFYIKRDDQTSEQIQLQGNKLRKLEFIFADAIIKHKAKHILTAGGLQSNHCRTVAALANQFNLKTHLFLRSHTNNEQSLNLNGNLLLNKLLDANIILIEKRAQYLESILYKMNLLENEIKQKSNETSYIIPIGGSNTIGLFGYLEAFEEMLNKQSIDQSIDDIIVTTGSGGTMSGLAIANYLTGSRFKLHAFCVCDNKKYFQSHLKQQYKDLFGNDLVDTDHLVNIIECSKGLGYAQSTSFELEFIAKFFKLANILLDPVYTGKTLFTFFNLINGFKPSLAYGTDEAAFDFEKNLKGNRILFIHTGGQLGLFDNAKFDSLFKLNQNI